MGGGEGLLFESHTHTVLQEYVKMRLYALISFF